MKYLASSIDDVIGKISPPVDADLYTNTDVNQSLGNFLSVIIQIFFLFAGLAALVYLLLGAYEWISSSGEKEKLNKAQQKILNAIVGLILIVVIFVVFEVIMGTVLGGKFGIGPGLKFNLPTIGP